jgi:hypothetical protein
LTEISEREFLKEFQRENCQGDVRDEGILDKVED